MDDVGKIEEKSKAGFVLRGGALVIDSLIVALPLELIFRAIGQKESYITSLIFLLYTCLMTANGGATLGKKFFGLKVISTDGEKVGLGKAFLREVLGKFVSSVVLSLGYFWVIWDKDKQSWHDKIAGTYVIKQEEIGKGKKLLASVIVWTLPILMFLMLFATIVLIAINPSRQLEKAREFQKMQEIQKEMNSEGRG